MVAGEPSGDMYGAEVARSLSKKFPGCQIYGLGGDKPRLLNTDLESDSPYNIYRRKGLPPTPIASPGRAALQAALAPEPGAWLFYVLADRDGRHAFAVTDAEFERLRRQAQAKGLL